MLVPVGWNASSRVKSPWTGVGDDLSERLLGYDSLAHSFRSYRCCATHMPRVLDRSRADRHRRVRRALHAAPHRPPTLAG
jgi:hypothetical protein